MITLRDYQDEGIGAFMKGRDEGLLRMIINLPTGTGKTILGMEMARQIGGRMLWLVHRDELIEQASRALGVMWPEAGYGVVKAERGEIDAQVVLASVQTISQPGWLRRLREQRFDLVTVDECHHAAAITYRRVMGSAGSFFGGTPTLGLTATVERGDNLSLMLGVKRADLAGVDIERIPKDERREPPVFQKVVYHMQLLEAIRRGHLVGVQVEQVVLNFDLDVIPAVHGDYHEGALGDAMLQAKAAEATAAAYVTHGSARKALVFTVTVEQAKRTCQALQDQGVAAAWISGSTPTGLRRSLEEQLKNGELQVICNCAVLTEGFDEPSVSCIVVARPTRSKPLYLQIIGRGLRTDFGKADCLIIDVAGATKRHTLIQAPVIFGLTEEAKEGESQGQRPDEPVETDMKDRLVASMVKASKEGAQKRSQFRWLQPEQDCHALPIPKGVILVYGSGEKWQVQVVYAARDMPPEDLTLGRAVWLGLAQGTAEDYIRRLNLAGLRSLTSSSAPWLKDNVSPKQRSELDRQGIQGPPGMTRGDASNLLTEAMARDLRRRYELWA